MCSCEPVILLGDKLILPDADLGLTGLKRNAIEEENKESTMQTPFTMLIWEEMREAIDKERRVDIFRERVRHLDLRRRKIAKDVFDDTFHRIKTMQLLH